MKDILKTHNGMISFLFLMGSLVKKVIWRGDGENVGSNEK